MGFEYLISPLPASPDASSPEASPEALPHLFEHLTEIIEVMPDYRITARGSETISFLGIDEPADGWEESLTIYGSGILLLLYGDGNQREHFIAALRSGLKQRGLETTIEEF